MGQLCGLKHIDYISAALDNQPACTVEVVAMNWNRWENLDAAAVSIHHWTVACWSMSTCTMELRTANIRLSHQDGITGPWLAGWSVATCTMELRTANVRLSHHDSITGPWLAGWSVATCTTELTTANVRLSHQDSTLLNRGLLVGLYRLVQLS